jgi:hypothetical protein
MRINVPALANGQNCRTDRHDIARMKPKSLWSVSMALLAANTALAAALPELVFPAGVGVNIHFTRGHERDLDLIAAAGFRWVRMDFVWASIERRAGEYDWSAYEELTTNLEARGLHALYILDYSNPLYEETVVTRNPVTGQEQRDTASPQRPESVAAFAKWAGAAARRFQGRPILWEIWNEPNITFWKPKPNVQQYTALALATCRAIRQADPAATIVAPATSGVPLDFLEEFFRSGILTQLDAVTVHPYRRYDQPPESAAEDYAKLRQLIRRYAPPGKEPVPILSGEWGYASHRRGVSLEVQAAFLARQQLANLLHGIPLSIWYDWKDDGPDPEEREHNFGTVTVDLQPKPAYRAAQTLTRELTGYRIVRRLEAGSAQDYVLLCENATGERKLAAWTTGRSHTVSLPLRQRAQAPLAGRLGTGEAFTVSVDGDRLSLEVSPLPRYLSVQAVALAD